MRNFPGLVVNTRRQRIQAVFLDAAGKRRYRTLATFAEAHIDNQGKPRRSFTNAQRHHLLYWRWVDARKKFNQELAKKGWHDRYLAFVAQEAAIESIRRRSGKRSRVSKGFIYVIDVGDARKVGVTTQRDCHPRINNYIHTAGPAVTIQLHFVFVVRDALRIEQKLHELLEHLRMTGEWYTPVVEVLDIVEVYIAGIGGKMHRERFARRPKKPFPPASPFTGKTRLNWSSPLDRMMEKLVSKSLKHA